MIVLVIIGSESETCLRKLCKKNFASRVHANDRKSKVVTGTIRMMNWRKRVWQQGAIIYVPTRGQGQKNVRASWGACRALSSRRCHQA